MRRASSSRFSVAAAACSALVARFSTADTSDGALARTIEIRRLGADGETHTVAQCRPQPLRHLLEQRAHAHRPRARRRRARTPACRSPACRAASGCRRSCRRSAPDPRRSRPAASFARHTAAPRRAACGSDARGPPPIHPGSAGAAGGVRNTCIKCDFGDVRRAAPPRRRRCSSRREILTNRPLRSSVCSPMPPAADARREPAPCAKSCPSSGSPSNSHRRGIAFLDLAARRRAPAHRPAGPSTSAERRAARCSLPACASRNSRSQLRDLAAQRVEGAGELLRNASRRRETPPEVQSDDFRSARDLWLPCRMKKATSVPCRYLPCLSTSYDVRTLKRRWRRQ